MNNQTAPGDALILAASIAYLGPFGPDIRTELLHKWRVLCQTGSINMNPEDPRTSLFTDSEPAPPDCPPSVSIPVAEKLQSAMARAVGVDQWQGQDINARLVVKLLLWGYRSPCVQRWPLLANAQHHAVLSSQSWLITGRPLDLLSIWSEKCPLDNTGDWVNTHFYPSPLPLALNQNFYISGYLDC